MGLSQDNIFRKVFRIVNYGLEFLLIKLYNRSFPDSNDISAQFHWLYYYSHTRAVDKTRWMGSRTMKCPLDLWKYQELLVELKPDFVIETGTNEGGGAYFLASVLNEIGKGKVIAVDIELLDNRPKHDRITYLKGSSTSDEIVEKISEMIGPNQVVMVILDSDHNKSHVLKEMEIYSKFVTKDSYLIVEDSNINGHPVMPNWGLGPFEAIQDFLKEDTSFKIDKDCEKFFLSYNPNGYLRKTS